MFFLLFLTIGFLIFLVLIVRVLFGGFPPMRKYNDAGYPDDADFERGSKKRHRRRRKEGEVSIDYIPPRKDMREEAKKYTEDSAEDVEFEEVKE